MPVWCGCSPVSSDVENTAAGTERLLAEVQLCARHQRVALEHVFFGGEDYPSFAENFLRRLRERAFLVVRVNAWEAKQQRSNFQASSDRLDLLGAHAVHPGNLRPLLDRG